MSGKLDQALGEIIKDSRTGKGRPGRRPRRQVKDKAPIGGVSKQKPTKKTDKTPTGPALKGESKVIVSKLPQDVTEAQIKEYFQKSIGPVKKVMIVFGPNGQSRGIANITFSQPDSASKAFRELNGIKVDNKPMKIDIIVDGKDAPPAPQPKKLGERIQAAKPKPATGTKTAKTAAGRARGGRKGAGAVKAAAGARRPKKTAEQLDADMDNYFVPTNGTSEGAPAAAAVPDNGDMHMDDDIS